MRYEYGGAVEGEFQRRIVVQCAKVAGMYGIRAADFDDVVHDAMVACMRGQRYDDGYGVKLWTYLGSIVRREAHRTCQRLARYECECVELDDDDGYEGDQGTSSDIRLLRSLVMALPRRMCIVLSCRYGLYGGRRFSVAETAVYAGISVSHTKTLQRQGLARLREAVEL